MSTYRTKYDIDREAAMRTKSAIGWCLFIAAALCGLAAIWLGSEQWALTGIIALVVSAVIAISLG